MNSRTRSALMAALSNHPEGLTRSQLIGMTGLSPATITTAIKELRLSNVSQHRPYRYALTPDSLKPERVYPQAVGMDGSSVVIPRTPNNPKNVVPKFEDWRTAVRAAMLAVPDLTPDADTAEVARQLDTLASSLASMAVTIREADGPEWFERLGGVIEDDTQEAGD